MSGSHLTADRYGYDTVVATTQRSINANLKRYLRSLTAPTITQVFIYNPDKSGGDYYIDFDEFLAKSHGTDPFDVPKDASPTSPEIVNLENAGFKFAFRARLGIPSGLPADEIPDIVQFDAESGILPQVHFNLFCAEFDICILTMGNAFTNSSWKSVSQPSKKPWLFKAKVNMSYSNVGRGQLEHMPDAVRKAYSKVDNSAYSLQQLMFNLSTATLYAFPELDESIDVSVKGVLRDGFLGAYFKRMRDNGEPLLGAAIIKNAPIYGTIIPTGMELMINRYVDNGGIPIVKPTDDEFKASTLNYVGVTGDKKLTDLTRFNWNWVSTSQVGDTHGVVAINRDTFARWIAEQLEPVAKPNCIKPWVYVGKDGLGLEYKWSFARGNIPTISVHTDKDVVCTLKWESPEAYDRGGWGEINGSMALQSWYNAIVSFLPGNTVQIEQNLLVWTKIYALSRSASGLIVNRKIIDVYEIVVENGNLLWRKNDSKSTSENHDYDPSTNKFLDFFNDIGGLMRDVKEHCRGFVPSRFQSPPFTDIRNFVFPGGDVFAFREASFSDYKDLTAKITYLNPNGTVHLAAIPEPSSSTTVWPET